MSQASSSAGAHARTGAGPIVGRFERPSSAPLVRRVAVVGNHLPRQCGIATFTSHLTAAIAQAFPSIDTLVLAVNDPGRRHAYPASVRFEIAETDPASYRRAADYLNVNDVDVVSLQHEFGIFGGRAGSHLLHLLEELRMPVVATLHTILAKPSTAQRQVIDEIARRAQRLVVMSTHGAGVLQEVYGIPAAQIDVIPHGIPQIPASGESKRRLGVEGHTVLLTFGLLSPDKGIEFVIDALPAIVAVAPDVVYIVLGATHPHVREQHGEAYRVMLEARARQLAVEQHVIFHDRFVSQEELNEFLGATDIYITPYLNPEQSTSGTLAYAVGSGRAVISTPYVYARELLADDRGVLVPSRDAAAIGDAVRDLLADDERRDRMRARAERHGRTMSWPAVAAGYRASFERAVRDRARDATSVDLAAALARRVQALPEVSLRHLHTMTDDTGLLQHASFSVPRYSEGYCLDDNARALSLMTRLEDAGAEDLVEVRALATRYLAFVNAAFDPARGRFRNFLSYARTWTEDVGSEDAQGRAVHALGSAVGRATPRGSEALAAQLFHAALPAIRDFTSPRAWATTLLGIEEYLRAYEGDRRVEELRGVLADRLLASYAATQTNEWSWFEEGLTYANAQLPHALITSGARMGRPDLVSVGLSSLLWLVSVQRTDEGNFAPIGSNGFSRRGGHAARFDQQPIEASTMVAACLEAERVSGESVWGERARCAFDWFMGRNHLGQWLYDASTGGCRDGLHVDRMNENQGAESTLAFLLALVDMGSLDRPQGPRGIPSGPQGTL
jgi:glycosyltransferase involved in cell wall biosynthesis